MLIFISLRRSINSYCHSLGDFINSRLRWLLYKSADPVFTVKRPMHVKPSSLWANCHYPAKNTQAIFYHRNSFYRVIYGQEKQSSGTSTNEKLFVCSFVLSIGYSFGACDKLTTEAFFASFFLFTARRGTPAPIFPDNRTNFTGTQAKLLQTQPTEELLIHWASQKDIIRHFLPKRATNFESL